MASSSGGYMYIPLERIIVEKQIRTGIDMESDSFKALVASVFLTESIPAGSITPLRQLLTQSHKAQENH